MRSIDIKSIDKLPGKRLKKNEIFNFRCHAGLDCFNRCCRNLNLFLYPYDIIRLKQRLKLRSDQFLDLHVDMVLRPGNQFPDMLLHMADNAEKTCPFLSDAGCTVYPDRPDACRTFPVEQGILFRENNKKPEPVYFFKPPDFCMGQHETRPLTITEWIADQDAATYNRMTSLWSEVKALFRNDPWGPDGIEGPRGKMAVMATYNMDGFRDFVFGSSFLTRYKVKSSILKTIQKDDIKLMQFGFEWIKLYLFGMKSKTIRNRS